MTDAPKWADTSQAYSDVAWEMASKYTLSSHSETRALAENIGYVMRAIHGELAQKIVNLAIKVLAAEGQACDALDRATELEAKNSRLRGIIAEMVMYDWAAGNKIKLPPDNLRKDVAEAIGFPGHQPDAQSSER